MSEGGALSVRQATAADLETILRHRRSMFEAMGHGGARLEASRSPRPRARR